MAADNAGEAVQGQHGTLAGAAAGDDVIGCAAVQQDGGQNAALHIGQLCGVIGSVHAVVDHLVAHGLHHLFQGGFNDAVLGGLTVLVDECDLHSSFFSFYDLLLQAQVLYKVLPHGGEEVQQDAGFQTDAAVHHAVLLEQGVAGAHLAGLVPDGKAEAA